jgi:Peroxisomal biogenesis factor 11 (PEX11)
MLIQYSLDIITHHMNTHTLTRLLRLVRNYLSFLPHTQQPVKLSTTPSSLSLRLKSLSAKLSDTRILLRLHGIVPTYNWMLNTHASPPSDPTLSTVTKLQTYANMLYFPLENAAYLASHKIIPMTERTETDLWIWSCRFWAAHVGLEFVRLYRERQLQLTTKVTAEKTEAEEKRDRRWWAELVLNLAYAPLTVHWSLEKGLGFRDVEIGYLGVIAAIASIYLGFPS